MKYIIDLPENTHWIQWIMEGSKDHHPYMDFKQVDDLTPYTEPDLDAVRNEAYKDGREAGIKDGMCEAWEAARKIVHLQWDGAWAGVDEVEKWFDTYTASEAIEKIRQHEQEQGKIKVGDEVEAVSGKAVIIELFSNGKYVRYMYPDAKEAIKIINGLIKSVELAYNSNPLTDKEQHPATEALNSAISALEKQEQDRWIPVTERLPKVHKSGNSFSGIFMQSNPVLVYGVAEYEEKAQFHVVTYCDNLDGHTYWSTELDALTIKGVKAWKSLPEPYTEEES